MNITKKYNDSTDEINNEQGKDSKHNNQHRDDINYLGEDLSEDELRRREKIKLQMLLLAGGALSLFIVFINGQFTSGGDGHSLDYT